MLQCDGKYLFSLDWATTVSVADTGLACTFDLDGYFAITVRQHALIVP